jgi:hypothetical protein
MKQLKIVQEEINTTSPFFTANFTESITIEPNSSVWFDKISFNIVSSGPNGAIQLGGQTIAIAPNLISSSLSQGYRSVYLAPATYESVDELYSALNKLFNSCLNTSPALVIGNKMPDVGLAFLVLPSTLDPTRTEIAFVQSECVNQTNPIAVNINLGTYWWTPSITPNDWSLIFPTPILAGGLRCTSAVYFPDLVDYGANECFIGLYSQTGLGPVYNYERTFGFILNDETWSYYNNGALSEIPNQVAFRSANDPPTRYMSWFVDANDGANLKVGLFDVDLGVTTLVFQSPTLTFQGYNVNNNYFFGADGNQNGALLPVQVLDPFITYMPHITEVNAGWRFDTGNDLNINYKGLQQLTFGIQAPFPEIAVIGPRNVRINFTQSQSLMQGLGFTSIINNLVGLEASITGSNPIGFVNFFDLALDLYNFTLDSYMSCLLYTSDAADD